MTVCFIVASMDNRIPFLEHCIDCYKASKYAECDIYCYFQGSKWESVHGREVFKEVVIDPNPRGVFTPRYELMKRFGKDYDYLVLIDDDLFIGPEADYFGMINILRSNKRYGAVCCLNVKRWMSKDVYIVGKNDAFNVMGGMVFPQKSIQIILDYFSDKEADYTFDCVWLLLWVYGYDLVKDCRSYAQHKTIGTQKVNGDWSGFNWSRVKMPYKPFLTEFLNEPIVYFSKEKQRYEHRIPAIGDVNKAGLEMRERCRQRNDF